MISPADVLVICGVAAAVATVGVVAGWLLLGAGARDRSMRWTLSVVVGVPVVVMGVGTTVAADLMVVSGHALAVLLVVVVAGAVASGAVGALLARRVQLGSAALSDAVGRLSDGDGMPLQAAAPSTRELANLWGQLDTARRDLLVARERELAAEAGRRELVAWVSHDLRAPLAAIQAMTEAMEDDIVSDPETVREYHRRIREEVERLSRLVAELFELSRITANAVDLDRRPVDLAALAREVVAVHTPLAASRGVALTSSTDLAVVADADPQQLSRVLGNLVVNGVQSTPAGGAVEVSCHEERDQVVLSVVDGCGGIPEHDLPRVFDAGFRGSTARTPSTDGGAGLGLAIVRGLVEAHDGTVEVAAVDGGCRFDVCLPARDAPPGGREERTLADGQGPIPVRSAPPR